MVFHCAFHEKWHFSVKSVALFIALHFPWKAPEKLYCVPNWLLSRPFDIILSLCTQMTPFKTIWHHFITVYPIDSFQDHLTLFYHSVPNWLSRPFDLILSLCPILTPFKTIWPNFIIVYPIESFQNYFTKFDHCVPNWLLWKLFHQVWSLCNQLTSFKTIWPYFIIV